MPHMYPPAPRAPQVGGGPRLLDQGLGQPDALPMPAPAMGAAPPLGGGPPPQAPAYGRPPLGGPPPALMRSVAMQGQQPPAGRDVLLQLLRGRVQGAVPQR